VADREPNRSVDVTSFAPKRPIEYRYTEGLDDILRGLGISLLVSTYQAGLLMLIRPGRRGLSTQTRRFSRPMGLSIDGRRIALATRNQIIVFGDEPGAASNLDSEPPYDGCILPRAAYWTGAVDAHELAWTGVYPVFVNTRFSCLCRPGPEYSFEPLWQPNFVSALKAEDRCHLNGLAIQAGKVRAVTAFGNTDTARGWRANRLEGGLVIDPATDRILANGLAMPHSPRILHGELWVLESATGEVLRGRIGSGVLKSATALPGFVRGLDFFDRYAFVGLSRLREGPLSAELPVSDRFDRLICGIVVLDCPTSRVVGHIEFTAGCTELFGVIALPNRRWPLLAGVDQEENDRVLVVPEVSHTACGQVR